MLDVLFVLVIFVAMLSFSLADAPRQGPALVVMLCGLVGLLGGGFIETIALLCLGLLVAADVAAYWLFRLVDRLS